MTTTWDPRRLLGVDPETRPFTCVGFAPSKGRRCHNPIAKSTLSEANSILVEMQRMDPKCRGFMDQISPKVNHLAATTLCKAYHRDKPGHSQRVLKHNEWMEIVSNWRNDMLANEIHALQAALPTPPVTPSSRASAAGSNSSFHDSDYSTPPSSTTSDSEPPLNEPAMLFPSPPSSVWSMDPPSPTPSSPSPEASSPSTARAQTPTSSNSASQSSRRSRNSSGRQAQSPSTTFANVLAASLTAVLIAEPSSQSVSSFSTPGSTNNSSSTRHASRSQDPSVTTANPLSASIATALATVLAEHITTALTQELAHSDDPAALLLQSLLGIQVPSRRSSRTSSHRSSRSSTSITPQAPPSPFPVQPTHRLNQLPEHL